MAEAEDCSRHSELASPPRRSTRGPGWRWSEASAGEVTVAMDVLDRHVNLQGLVHGGMLAILADTACGLSIRSAMEPGRLHVTTDLDIHYLAPAEPGRLFGRGKAIKVGRSLAFAEASIEDGEGRLLARAQSRFSVSGRETAAD